MGRAVFRESLSNSSHCGTVNLANEKSKMSVLRKVFRNFLNTQMTMCLHFLCLYQTVEYGPPKLVRSH